jgi:hypothetical protein
VKKSTVAGLLLTLALLLRAQTVPEPEDGFISPEGYTNAFFGFSVPFPRGIPLKPLRDNGGGKKPERLSLFGANSVSKGYPVFVILADDLPSVRNNDSKSALRALGVQKVRNETVGGKDFAVGQSKEDGIYKVFYATALKGYMLYFSAFAYDKNVLAEFEHSIDAIEFFDPATARQHAGPDSQPYKGPRHSSE